MRGGGGLCVLQDDYLPQVPMPPRLNAPKDIPRSTRTDICSVDSNDMISQQFCHYSPYSQETLDKALAAQALSRVAEASLRQTEIICAGELFASMRFAAV